MEKLKERSQINKNDCWDISKIIKNDNEFEKLLSSVNDKSAAKVAMKGHILDSSESLERFIKLDESEEREYNRLLLYTKFLYDEDTTNNASKEKMLKVENLGCMINESESFITSEFMEKNYEDVLKLIDDHAFLKDYKLYFKRLYKDKERVLSEKEEKIIALAMNAFGTPDDAFTSLDVADAKFLPVFGKELNQYNFPEYLENEKQEIRREAFMNCYQYYASHKNTFASLLKGNYEELEFIRKIRKYNTALEMALDSINVSPKVYENLITKVHEYNYINIDYQKLKAKKLGLKEYHLYDTYVPIVASPTKKYTKEEAINTLTNALKVLGPDYLSHFKYMFDNQCIDFYPNKGKHNGAYQWGSYDTSSYVLLNFNGTFDSVSTMAHELGHAVHSMYSKENNSYPYYDYEIFLAEIASTVNETLLSVYMYDNAKTPEEKIFYLCEFLDKVKATIYRQTMFAEFESIMSKKCQDGVSLTEEEFSNTYYHLNEEYFKDSVIVDESIRYEYMRISHFYSPFYVYQYATGLIAAICIVSDILSDSKFKDKYIKFLQSGCNKDVLELLKIVDIDFTEYTPFDKAFTFIKEKYNELKTLLESSD